MVAMHAITHAHTHAQNQFMFRHFMVPPLEMIDASLSNHSRYHLHSSKTTRIAENQGLGMVPLQPCCTLPTLYGILHVLQGS